MLEERLQFYTKNLKKPSPSDKRGKYGRAWGWGVVDWLGSRFGTYCSSSAFMMVCGRGSCRRQWQQAGGSGVSSR